MINSNTLEEYALFHKALAEPIRLRILTLLNSRPSLCVCDLVTVLGLSQSTVSRHLAYLKNQNLVRSWREGNWMHYALQQNHPAIQVLKASLSILADNEMVQNDQSALENYQKSPRQCKVVQ